LDVKDKIFLGSALDVLKTFPDSCIDMCITSSPYYGQRFYGKDTNTIWGGDKDCQHNWDFYIQEEKFIEEGREVLGGKQLDIEFSRGNKNGFCTKCGAWYGNLGNEPIPSLFIQHLIEIYNEVKRVLKPTGLFYCNIGDSNCGSQSGYGLKIPNPKSIQSPMMGYSAASVMKPVTATCAGAEEWLKPKQLMLIPSRLAIAMQEDGWILRRDIIWWKKSALPTQVLDNFGSEYEHIFMFSKEPYYYFDTSKARRPYAPVSIQRQKYAVTRFGADGQVKCSGPDKDENAVPCFIEPNPKGALKGDVWRIGTANTKYKHTAAYSEELVESCLLPGCAKEVCVKCGRPKIERYKMVVRDMDDLSLSEKLKYKKIQEMKLNEELKAKILIKLQRKKISLGFLPTCKCEDTSFEPGIVLDPFSGTGTSVVVAKKYGYHYCGIEMNKEYFNIIETRIKEML
jgi:DNA modification methylase